MNLQAQIRAEWFPSHSAVVDQLSGLTVINWFEKGTSMYSMKIILSGRNVIITGDVGEVVFTFSSPVTIKDLSKMNMYYLAEKVSAFSNPLYVYSTETARKNFKDHLENIPLEGRYKDHVSIRSEMHEIIEDAYSLEDLSIRVHSLYSSTSLDSEDASAFSQFGKELHSRIVGYHVAFQMINEQLVAQEKEVQPV